MIRQRVRVFARVLGAAMLIAVFASVGAAQDFDVAGGYAYLHEKDLSVPAGWFASVGGHVSGPWDIVGAVTGHYKTEDEAGASVKINLHTFGAGPRFMPNRTNKVSPYVQVLFGGARASATAKSGSSTLSDSESGFDIEPGAGIDINTSSGMALRLGIAEDFLRSGGEWSQEFQFWAGVVFRR